MNWNNDVITVTGGDMQQQPSLLIDHEMLKEA